VPCDLPGCVFYGLQRGVDHRVVVLDRKEPCTPLQRTHAAAQERRREGDVGGAVEAREVAVIVGRRVEAEADMEDAGETRDDGPDAGAVERQIARTTAYKAAQDTERVGVMLGRVTAAARSGDNLLPVLKDALIASATLGQTTDVLRSVFGQHRPGG